MESANRLSARRVLVLVPTLDLLLQMASAWRVGGRPARRDGRRLLPARRRQPGGAVHDRPGRADRVDRRW
ncbi:hypothetical protein ACWC6I_10450 [Streptomyces sp. NPDC001414]